MNKRFKQVTALVTTTALALSLTSPSQNVFAAEVLPLDGTVAGTLKQEQEIVYDFSLKKSGNMSFDISSFVQEADFELYDDQNHLIMSELMTSDGKTPEHERNAYYLESGNYHFVISDSSYSRETGNYTVKTAFKDANAMDLEPNNGTSEAQALPFGAKTIGLISEQDDRDVYKVVLPRAGSLSLDFSSYAQEGLEITLTDSYNKSIFNDYVNSTETTPGKLLESTDLEAGTYYVSIDRSYVSDTGIYNLLASFKAAGNNESEPNNGVVEAQKLALYKKMTGLLSWNDTDDYYKIVLPKKSTVTLDFSSYIYPDALIEVIDTRNQSLYVEDVWGKRNTAGRTVEKRTLSKGTYYVHVSSDYTGIYKLQVKSSHLLPALAVNTVKKSATSVNGKTEKNAAVSMMIGKKTYKGKANAKGQFKLKIAKQKVGTTIKVTAKNKYGTSTKVLKVKK
ncbi:Ig-like domain-containing protein [Exiguobacterium sp. s193]|uniref:Ig-like domain-containing protein n=1 Tax=Exiguobacterium sp. s193 TaxID=2751207 RepID=UPI001BEA5961|nr:Ig-like domain-containing protein [Exiguobacterium sp. s193]